MKISFRSYSYLGKGSPADDGTDHIARLKAACGWRERDIDSLLQDSVLSDFILKRNNFELFVTFSEESPKVTGVDDIGNWVLVLTSN